jgi:hypothetical protein
MTARTPSPLAPRAPVTVHIDRLVLEGLPCTAAQGVRLQRALEAELARLCVTGAPLRARGGRADATVRAPSLTVPAGAVASPVRLGRDIARSLFTLLEDA